jgi:hypothetical protein
MDDCRQIENLIYSYAERIDQGDLAGVAELFRHSEIRAPAQDSVCCGYDAVFAMYQASTRLYDNGTPLTRHLTHNLIIELADDGSTAATRCSYTVLQATPELPLQPIIIGRYHDSFIKVDGLWRFKVREMHVDLLGDLSAHLLFDPASLA